MSIDRETRELLGSHVKVHLEKQRAFDRKQQELKRRLEAQIKKHYELLHEEEKEKEMKNIGGETEPRMVSGEAILGMMKYLEARIEALERRVIALETKDTVGTGS